MHTHRFGLRTAAVAGVVATLAGCSGSPAGASGPEATEPAVRAVATDFVACSGTTLGPRGEADCYAGAVSAVGRLRVPAALSGLARDVSAAGVAVQQCYAQASLQTLDRCSTAQARFFGRLTDLEFSIAQPAARAATAPPYWSLAPSPSLQADIGAVVYDDSLDPPEHGWPIGRSWSINQDLRYRAAPPPDRHTVVEAPEAPALPAFEISVDVRFAPGAGRGAAGVECRGGGAGRYMFAVSTQGVTSVSRTDLTSAPTTVRYGAADAELAGVPLHVSAACFTLSTSGDGATTRLLLFVNGRLAIDAVDTWRGQPGRDWRGGLAAITGQNSTVTALFSDLVVRDFSRPSPG